MVNSNASQIPPKNSSFGMCNPVIKKMATKSKEEGISETVSAYKGIVMKSLYLILFCVAGIIVFYAVHAFIMANTPVKDIVRVDNFENFEGIIAMETAPVELIIFAVTGLVSFIVPLLAFFIKSTIPVTGTLYALCEGYFIGAISSMLTPEYKWIAVVAFVITVAIVVSMLFLYSKGMVRFGKKARTVIFAFFISSILCSIVMLGLYFIPATRPVVSAITTFMNNPIVSIIFSLIYLVIAILFLLSDFEAIRECVENKMPKKYEWLCAFGLVYSIIYIYFKILNIILQIVGASSSKDK